MNIIKKLMLIDEKHKKDKKNKKSIIIGLIISNIIWYYFLSISIKYMLIVLNSTNTSWELWIWIILPFYCSLIPSIFNYIMYFKYKNKIPKLLSIISILIVPIFIIMIFIITLIDFYTN